MKTMVLLSENSLKTLLASNREFSINNAYCIREFNTVNAYFYFRAQYNQC